MLKLIIKETGHIFFAPGIPEVRTPVEIIITKLNRASLIINLRSQGISNYKIVEIPKINVEKKKPEEKSVPNPLNEIDNYIDMIGEDISNAIGELNGNELRI